ncbi:MAG: hypothetical protein WDA16_01090 [Candidatus Thermoplasmatota archaeon]
MRLLVSLLVVSALLVGCVSPASQVTPASGALQVATGEVTGNDGVMHLSHEGIVPMDPAVPRLVGGEFTFPASATEPSIGADLKGGVYMTGFGSGGATAAAGRTTPTIWATFDHGATMKDVGPKLPTGDGRHANTNDPILFVDPITGRIFMDDILPLSCGVLSWSDDKGASWTTNPYSCGNSNLNDHQTIGTAKARAHPTVGYPDVVYRCVNNVAVTGCAMSFTGGLSFTPQVPVFVMGRDDCSGLTGHLKAGADGKVYLPKADCPGGPLIKVSEDDGITWTDIKIKTDREVTNHDLGLAIDSNNALYATFESGGMVWFTASPDGGKTWLPERNVTAPGVTATMFNALAVGAPGKVAFAYVGSTIPGGYEEKGMGNGGLAGDLLGQPSLPEWDNATWNAYFGVITDALDPNAPVQSVMANDVRDPLARGLCGGTRCHGMNDFIDITVDSEGRPWASFVDVCTQKCVTDPTVKSDKALGAMMTVREGPNLRMNETMPLASILPQPVK